MKKKIGIIKFPSYPLSMESPPPPPALYGIPTAAGSKTRHGQGRNSTSSYITYDDYPRSSIPERPLPPRPQLGNAPGFGYKIPTYTPPPPVSTGAGVSRPMMREEFTRFTQDDLNALSKLNAPPPPSPTPTPNPSPSLQQAAAAPAGTPAPDLNPMSIPCLTVYSHLKDCPLCRQSIAALHLAQECQNSQKSLSILIIMVGTILGIVILGFLIGVYLYVVYGRHIRTSTTPGRTPFALGGRASVPVGGSGHPIPPHPPLFGGGGYPPNPQNFQR